MVLRGRERHLPVEPWSTPPQGAAQSAVQLHCRSHQLEHNLGGGQEAMVLQARRARLFSSSSSSGGTRWRGVI